MVRQTYKANRGDLFSIPIDESRFALGQVVDLWQGTILVVVFTGDHSLLNDALPLAAGCGIDLMAIPFDALLCNGTWQILGNEISNLDRIPRPYFLIGPPEECVVEDFHGKAVRCADGEDLKHLKYRKIMVPIRVQKAAMALHGVGDWEKDFERLKMRQP